MKSVYSTEDFLAVNLRVTAFLPKVSLRQCFSDKVQEASSFTYLTVCLIFTCFKNQLDALWKWAFECTCLPHCLHLKPNIFLNAGTLCACAVQSHGKGWTAKISGRTGSSARAADVGTPVFGIVDVQAVLRHPHGISRNPVQRAHLIVCWCPVFSHTQGPPFAHISDGVFLNIYTCTLGVCECISIICVNICC